MIDALRKLVPRMEAARRVYDSSIEQQRAVTQERATLEAAMQSMRPPSEGAFYTFLALLAAGAFGFIASGYPYIAAGVFAVTILPMLWYRRQLRLFQGMVQQFDSCAERMETCANEVRAIEEEARCIDADDLAS